MSLMKTSRCLEYLLLVSISLYGCGDKDDAPRSPKAVSLSTGFVHACEVRSNASLWCWGYGNQGQLGGLDLSDPVIETASPQRVGQDYDWLWVEAGLAHNCAARTDGTVSCWGFNVSGELGAGSPESFVIDPTPVSSTAAWTSVSACKSCGQAYNLGIQSDGSLWAWGTDFGGRLGLDPTTQTSVPLQVGADSDWMQVDAGVFVSLGIKSDGTLWGWGENAGGLIGDGTNDSRLAPAIVGADADWAQVATGGYRSCAVKTDGTLWCWGSTDGNAPVAVDAGATYSKVEVGGLHTCAIRTDGTLWCAGNNAVGQLGIDSRDAAVDLTQVGEETDWVDVVAANDFTCGIRGEGTRWCWGYNWRSQLGTGTPAGKRSPSAVVSETPLAAVAASATGSTVGVGADGSLWQWGLQVAGPAEQAPIPVGADVDWAQATAGSFHGCGIRSDGTLWCWGLASDGALGDGNDTGVAVDPVPVGNAAWSTVTAGLRYSCGVQSGDGSLWCWGYNLDGQLGNGTTMGSLVPMQVDAGTQWTDVSAGESHTCGVQTGGSAWCWGSGNSGELGDGNGSSFPSPVPVIGGNNWRQLSVGRDFTCGTRSDGSLWCWGENYAMQLGTDTGDSDVPTRVGTDSDWDIVDAGVDHACALKTNGTMWCWGDHIEGQAGVGGSILPLFVPPTRVGTHSDWVSVDAGGFYTCASRAGGTAHCFGFNRIGQLGDATSWYMTPQAVQ